jgi:hypothetical protein
MSDGPESVETVPIFIGGVGRSGTSLLRTLLNAHPNIAIGQELKITPAIVQLWQHAMRHASHLERYFFLEKDEINHLFRGFINSLLSKYRKRYKKPRIGEKTPNNIAYFRQIHQISPRSPLLHIIRDGRDVVCSLLKQSWTNGTGEPLAMCSDPVAAAKYWRQFLKKGRDAAKSSKSLDDQYLEVRYEDLVSSTERTARRIIDHLGEPWDPVVLNFYQEEYPEHCGHVHRPISSYSVGRWENELSVDVKERIKPIIGDFLIDLNYDTNMDW